MFDSNEIPGFISDCRNLDYLLDLRAHVDKRIRELGGAGRRAREMTIVPGSDNGRPLNQPSKLPWVSPPSVPPTPPPVPSDVAGSSGTAESVDNEKPFRPDFDGRRIVVGQTMYVIEERLLDGVRVAFKIRSMQGGTYFVVEKPVEDRVKLLCDCPDFVKRGKEFTGVRCKHIVAVRAAFTLPEEPPPAPPVVAEPASTPASAIEGPDVPVLATVPEV